MYIEKWDVTNNYVHLLHVQGQIILKAIYWDYQKERDVEIQGVDLSDCCLTQSQQFFSYMYIMTKTTYS